VTGAARGIGLAAAQSLALLGAKVLMVDNGCAVDGSAEDPAVTELAADRVPGASALVLDLAAPVTLLLRALPVPAARGLSRVLGSAPSRAATDPLFLAVLTVGGLWIVYTTGLYALMHTSTAVHVLVHAHLVLVGYLFTAAVLESDPHSRRHGFPYRSAALVMALAAHDILAKYLYARPPPGVAATDAETGSIIMYYGGDAVDLVLIVLLCGRWYRARPRRGFPASGRPVRRR
jgi:putative membrane protein